MSAPELYSPAKTLQNPLPPIPKEDVILLSIGDQDILISPT